MILNVFALVVLAALVATVVAAVVFLGMLPGKIAFKREHPQAEAIRVAGWVGILAGGVFWPLALIWAFVRPVDSTGGLRARVNELEAELAELKGGKS